MQTFDWLLAVIGTVGFLASIIRGELCRTVNQAGEDSDGETYTAVLATRVFSASAFFCLFLLLVSFLIR